MDTAGSTVQLDVRDVMTKGLKEDDYVIKLISKPYSLVALTSCNGPRKGSEYMPHVRTWVEWMPTTDGKSAEASPSHGSYIQLPRHISLFIRYSTIVRPKRHAAIIVGEPGQFIPTMVQPMYVSLPLLLRSRLPIEGGADHGLYSAETALASRYMNVSMEQADPPAKSKTKF